MLALNCRCPFLPSPSPTPRGTCRQPRVRPGDGNSLALSMYLHNNTFVLNGQGTFHRVVGAVHHVGTIWADNSDGFGCVAPSPAAVCYHYA